MSAELDTSLQGHNMSGDFIQANDEIEWAQERLEHVGIVLKTMEIT